MNELKTTTKLVKAILEQDKRARNSDSYLYLKVLETRANRNGIDLKGMTVPFFLEAHDILGFPGFETVRRTRQKIQVAFPNLAPCKQVQEMRQINEEEFREYARSVLHV